MSASRLQWLAVAAQAIGLGLAFAEQWRVAFVGLNVALFLWVQASRKAR